MRAGHLRADDAIGCCVAAFHVAADRAEDAVREGQVGTARHDRVEGLRAAFGPEDFDLEPRFLEETGGLREFHPGTIPEAFLRDGHFQLLRLSQGARADYRNGE